MPVLIKDGPPEENPWGIKFMLMLMMNTDSHLFRTSAQLTAEGWTLDGNRFVRSGEAYLPLYEGKMIHHFDHRFGTYAGQTQAQANQGKLPELTGPQHGDPELFATPRYWVSETDVVAAQSNHKLLWHLGFRRITSAVVLRTAVFAILPDSAISDSAFLMRPESPAQAAPALLSTSCSLVFDYVARQKMGGTNFLFYLTQQLPYLGPETFARVQPTVSRDSTLFDWLLPRVIELTYTAWDLEAFARDCGYDGPPFRWDDERRFLLRAELDAAYFHLYGIERDDVDYILDTFPIVKRKDIARYGEYRTKRAILEIYDAMAQAQRTGVAYATRLNPPAADPRVAHPPR